MGKKCAIKNCARNSDNTRHTFHSFPLRNNIKYKRWLRSIPEDLIELPLCQNTYICSIHFANDAYQPVTPTFKNILQENATPSIFYTFNEDTKENIKSAPSITEQTLSEQEIYTMTKKAYMDACTQISPERKRVLKTEIKLRRQVHILQKRLRRRDKVIKKMREIIVSELSTLDTPQKLNGANLQT